MSRKFGVELEMKGISREKAVRVLSAIGINIQSESYNHQRRANWKIVPDGSVQGGFEVVSPVLCGSEGLEELRAVVTALNDAGGKVDRQCGLHVHFDAADLNVDHVRAIVSRYAAHEAKIDSFMPLSRRANNNRYCGSLSSLVAGSAFRNAATLHSLVESQPGRYFKVNLQSYRVHGTVEFRQHSGTLDAPKVLNWVCFLAAFIEECKAKVEGRNLQATAPAPAQPRLSGVQLRLADMFGANTFLRLEAIMEQFGWQAHSVRAAVTRLRQAGLNIVSQRVNGQAAYRLQGNSPAPTSASSTDDLFDGVAAHLRTFYQNRATVLALN